MLKYCEAYRTMRESLCRGHSRGDFCKGDTETRGDEGRRISFDRGGFSSQTQNQDCRVSKDETHKSLTEDGDGLEKQFRRQSVSFEEEFTFTPRLNMTSLRMAKERSGRAHEAVERKTTALEAEVEMTFTFKPKVSSKSEKIAQGLKTSFFERQLIHVEKQKKKLDTQDVMQPSYFSQSRLSPVIHPPRHRKLLKSELSKSERSQTDGKIVSELEKTKLTRSAPDCLTAAAPKKQDVCEKISTMDHTNKRENDQRDLYNKTEDGIEELVENSPYSCSAENLSQKRSKQALRRHKRMKTYPGVNNSKDVFVESGNINKDGKKSTEGHHKRASTISGLCLKGQYHNIPIFNRLKQSKETAENAIRDHKVFVCHGPYPIVRASLRKRGWVEKHFKGCPAVAANRSSRLTTSNQEQKENLYENEDNAREGSRKISLDRIDEQDGYDDCDSTLWSAGYENENCEYSLLSRFCRNATASFFWTCKRDDIDFKYLRKDQMANHFSKAYSFTTKVGLCSHLRNLSWFENARSDTFFPRCHRLGSDEEKEDFIDDYRITSACNILKWLLKHSGDQPATAVPSIVKSNSMTSVRSGKLNHSGSSTNDRFQPPPQRSKSSVPAVEDSSVIGQVPSRAVTLALLACEEFIKCRKNEDIDEHCKGTCLTEENWQELIGYYYQIIHNGRTIEGAQEFSGKCQEMLEEMREFLPQLNLDGMKNVWIVKPGAKSRGRGIMCMDRLQDILKLVSSTVKKENRWIVQKYIECPLLVYNTKFDIRQWFLVTDWNPLTLWFYKDSYLRFCSQEFTLDNFEPCIHLANNSIQKHYQNGVRDERLPENNMWSSDDFREYLRERGKGNLWEEMIYPGMKQAIVYTLECCQITLEARKNSFELYGADFMLGDDYKPWLIEINSSPAMSASTMVTRKLCANVIEDTMKVVLDRREDKNCDTGRFELAFKQPYVDAPPYIGINLSVQGKQMPTRSVTPFRRQSSGNRLQQLAKPKEKTPKTMDENSAKCDENTLSVNVSGDGHDHNNSKTSDEEKTELDEIVLKPKENNLTLDCADPKSDGAVFPAKITKQTCIHGNSVNINTRAEFPRRWRAVEVSHLEKRQDGGRGRQLETWSMKQSVKPVHKRITVEKKIAKSTSRGKIMKKKRIACAEDNESKLQPRVITIPDVGVRRTILRYTDKRFRHTKTVPIDMGPETKLRHDTEAVK